MDNCISVINTGQENLDGDEFGNLRDLEVNGDGIRKRVIVASHKYYAYDNVIICLPSEVDMRTIVDLPEKQIEALKRMSESAHLSRAELMRRAVDEFLVRHQHTPGDEAFGLWKKRQTDGVTYQEHARAEWDR